MVVTAALLDDDATAGNGSKVCNWPLIVAAASAVAAAVVVLYSCSSSSTM
jgi:hypothetical protein